jgi:hypothetical protein
MKKIGWVLVCLFVVVTSVCAQEKSPEAKAKLKTEAMARGLSLTPQQVNALSALHLKSYTALAAAEKQCGDDKDCYKKKKKALKSDREAAYKKILTMAQLKQWDALKEQEDKSKAPAMPTPSVKPPVKK